jgi:hypothetical protein
MIAGLTPLPLTEGGVRDLPFSGTGEQRTDPMRAFHRVIPTAPESCIPMRESTDTMTANRRAQGRRFVKDRRVAPVEKFSGEERRVTERRKVERRRQIDPTTCERDYQPEEVEFMRAMDDYKRRSGRPFPTWSEVLEVVRDLGYRKVAEPMVTFESIQI